MPVPFLLRLLAFSVLALSLSAEAQTYRWTDKEGRVHYTDTPPPNTAAKGEEKNLKGNVASGGDLPFATQEAMKNYPVKLYSADKCAPCDDGRTLLTKRGIPFVEIKVGDDPSRAELKKLDDAGGLPVLKVGSDVIKGYEAGRWNGALDTVGYPKIAPTSVKTPVPTSAKPNIEAPVKSGPYSTQ